MSELPLFERLLGGLSPENQQKVKAFFEGYGHHEILAIYNGPHCLPAIKKVGGFVGSKSHMIRMFNFQAGDLHVAYVRGTFIKEDYQFLLQELHSCVKEDDKLMTTRP